MFFSYCLIYVYDIKKNTQQKKKSKPNREVIHCCNHSKKHVLKSIIPFPRATFGYYLKDKLYEIRDYECNQGIFSENYIQCSEGNLLIRNSYRNQLNIDPWEENIRNIEKVFQSLDNNYDWIVAIVLKFLFVGTNKYYNIIYWIQLTVNEGLNFHVCGGKVDEILTSDMESAHINVLGLIKECSFFSRIHSYEDVVTIVSGFGTGCIFPEPNPILNRLLKDTTFKTHDNNALCVLIRMGVKHEILTSEKGWKDTHQLITLMSYEHYLHGHRLKTDCYYAKTCRMSRELYPMHLITWAFCPINQIYYSPRMNCGCS